MKQYRTEAQRIVIKLGTRVLTKDDGDLAFDRLADLISPVLPLVAEGKDILIVTSGAVGLGRKSLGLKTPLNIQQKQACAAVGQNLLMQAYQRLLESHGLKAAQILLTSSDLSDRVKYLSLKATLELLLKMRVVPIMNENDTVSTQELVEKKDRSFGDNDKLSALVASKLDADLLILLTDVDGIYTDNPKVNPKAVRLNLIQRFSALTTIQTVGKSDAGRGGMASKIQAARIASISGVPTVVASGFQNSILRDLLHYDLDHLENFPGTLILPQWTISKRKHWIGFSSGYNGILTVNAGAHQALTKKFASLLPVGIEAVQGEFAAGQVVSLQNEMGAEIGRGIAEFSAQEIEKIKGHKSEKLSHLLGKDHGERGEVVVHRDHLVIFEEFES